MRSGAFLFLCVLSAVCSQLNQTITGAIAFALPLPNALGRAAIEIATDRRTNVVRAAHERGVFDIDHKSRAMAIDHPEIRFVLHEMNESLAQIPQSLVVISGDTYISGQFGETTHAAPEAFRERAHAVKLPRFRRVR